MGNRNMRLEKLEGATGGVCVSFVSEGEDGLLESVKVSDAAELFAANFASQTAFIEAANAAEVKVGRTVVRIAKRHTEI